LTLTAKSKTAQQIHWQLRMFELKKVTLFVLGVAAFVGIVLTATQWPSATVHAAPAAQSESASGHSQSSEPSYDFFKSNVEPIFLKERPGHARCYGCHTAKVRIFRLEQLTSGSTTWTEEQSQHNYETALKLVIPGDPASSKLLLHPLAPEAGGDAFHSGGRQFASQDDPDWRTLAQWVRGNPAATSSGFLVYVTNSAADTIDVVDPGTNHVIQVISSIELSHGIGFSTDGARVFVSTEAESVLDVVDRQNGEILQKVALSGRPNNIAVTNDGSRVLVGIRSGPAVVDVIDTNTLQRTKSIPVDGNVHNIFITPDGKYAVSGSLENKTASVIDLQTEKMVWEVKFDKPVRPMAFEANSDGSTRRIFVQLSGVNGFAVVDFAKQAEVTRIKLPGQPGGFGDEEGRSGVPSHGIGTAPDGKSLWVNSTPCNCVFKYSLPALTLAGHAKLPEIHTIERRPTGSVPEWITFSPDSKLVYVSDSAARLVTVIDTRTLKSVAQIQVGEVPKRMKTLVLH
jgi:YVTN family beta-propeller protein